MNPYILFTVTHAPLIEVENGQGRQFYEPPTPLLALAFPYHGGTMERVKLWSAIIFLVILAAWSDVLLEPEAGAQLSSRAVAFHKIGMSNRILVDDNMAFSSPVELQKPFAVTLQPGIYYWKSSGMSETRNFSIIGVVSITVNTTEDQTLVRNTGNTELLVEDRGSRITGAFILDFGKQKYLNKTEGMIVAKQHE